MALNVSLRDSGLGLTLAGLVVIGVLVVVVVVPFWVGGVALGLALAPALTGGAGLVLLGAAYTAAPLLAAVLSLLAGDARAMDWERLQGYPVPPRALFLGEVLASCTHPLMAAGLGFLVCLSVALAVRVPGTALPLALVALTALGTQLAARMLLALAAGWLVRNLRLLLLVAAFLVPGLLAGELAKGGALEVGRGWVGAAAVALAERLPSTLQVRAVAGAGLAPLWGPVLVPLGLFGLAWWLAFRPAKVANSAPARPERLWSFRSPTLGVARLHLVAIWSSELGRMSLLGPLAWLAPALLARTLPLPEASAGVSASWLALSACLTPPLFLSSLLGNQLGTDRGSVKALFLLPLGERPLLRGKAVALTALVVGYWAALSAVVVVVASPPLLVVLAAWCSGLAAYLVQLAIGQWTSLVWPRPLPRKGLRQPPGGLLPGLVSLAASLTTALPLAGLWLWLQGSPLALLEGSAVLAAGAAALFAVFSRQAEGLMRLKREHLVERLS
jgi:hypothetical protein